MLQYVLHKVTHLPQAASKSNMSWSAIEKADPCFSLCTLLQPLGKMVLQTPSSLWSITYARFEELEEPNSCEKNLLAACTSSAAICTASTQIPW